MSRLYKWLAVILKGRKARCITIEATSYTAALRLIRQVRLLRDDERIVYMMELP